MTGVQTCALPIWIVAATKEAGWALGTPFVIFGGIYGGVFSPTEAAAVACVYAAFVTAVVFRELTLRDIVEAAASTVLFTGQILIIVACAGVFAWLLTVNQVPAAMTAWLQSLNVSAWTLLLAAPVLGERLTASRIGAVVFGLLGVLVILRPGLATFQPGALLTLVAALGLAIALIATKKLTRTDSTFAIVFWMMLIQLPLAKVLSDRKSTRLNSSH